MNFTTFLFIHTSASDSKNFNILTKKIKGHITVIIPPTDYCYNHLYGVRIKVTVMVLHHHAKQGLLMIAFQHIINIEF